MATKKLPRPFKILLTLISLLFLTILVISVGNFVYCHSVAYCHFARPTMSPERIEERIQFQYEYAIQDINTKRYDVAKQRLEYIISLNPEYPNAKEKLLEVEDAIKLTPTP